MTNYNINSIARLALVLTIGSLNSISPVHARGAGTGYINRAEQFPQGRTTPVRHTIQLTLPTAGIGRIQIVAPEGIKVNRNIDIYNDTTQQSLSPLLLLHPHPSNDVQIDFPQALPANTRITIDLNRVRLWGLARNYQVYYQLINSSRYYYLGAAEFDRY